MALHLRKNDLVEVICGDHRGARGKVLHIDPKKGKVVVEGVNVVYRHVRPTRRNPQGGRVQKEAAIHISNVLPLDSSVGKAQRVHFVVDEARGGKGTTKRRVSKAGTTLHVLTRGERTAKN